MQCQVQVPWNACESNVDRGSSSTTILNGLLDMPRCSRRAVELFNPILRAKKELAYRKTER